MQYEHRYDCTWCEEEVNAEFTALYPNVTINHQQVGGYDDVRDQVITNMGTGDYPNVAYCYPDHVAIYNEAEITVSLDDVMSNSKYGLGGSELRFDGPVKEDYIQAFFEEGQQFGDGLTYTITIICYFIIFCIYIFFKLC